MIIFKINTLSGKKWTNFQIYLMVIFLFYHLKLVSTFILLLYYVPTDRIINFIMIYGLRNLINDKTLEMNISIFYCKNMYHILPVNVAIFLD